MGEPAPAPPPRTRERSSLIRHRGGSAQIRRPPPSAYRDPPPPNPRPLTARPGRPGVTADGGALVLCVQCYVLPTLSGVYRRIPGVRHFGDEVWACGPDRWIAGTKKGHWAVGELPRQGAPAAARPDEDEPLSSKLLRALWPIQTADTHCGLPPQAMRDWQRWEGRCWVPTQLMKVALIPLSEAHEADVGGSRAAVWGAELQKELQGKEQPAAADCPLPDLRQQVLAAEAATDAAYTKYRRSMYLWRYAPPDQAEAEEERVGNFGAPPARNAKTTHADADLARRRPIETPDDLHLTRLAALTKKADIIDAAAPGPVPPPRPITAERGKERAGRRLWRAPAESTDMRSPTLLAAGVALAAP
eukprot:TRINITY_DN7693_c0_g2_i1.p1 TRINITY_DN7693_c0_g2~~TRINITY_DN7693_c0_g2_i1.p1  ORF type:complete len:373 (+),score=98.41 TRINITY_DN7693_c0_g2_i1:42-1121(+)